MGLDVSSAKDKFDGRYGLKHVTEQAYRYENALKWIRHLAGLHYFGGAFEPEHMRDLCNMASAALAEDARWRKDLPDYDASMEGARLRASKWAEELGIDLIRDEDVDRELEKEDEAGES